MNADGIHPAGTSNITMGELLRVNKMFCANTQQRAFVSRKVRPPYFLGKGHPGFSADQIMQRGLPLGDPQDMGRASGAQRTDVSVLRGLFPNSFIFRAHITCLPATIHVSVTVSVPVNMDCLSQQKAATQASAVTKLSH